MLAQPKQQHRLLDRYLQPYLNQRRARRYTIIKESPSVRLAVRRERTAGGLLAVLFVVLITSVQMASAQTTLAESHSSMSLNEVEAGTLLFASPHQGHYIPALSQTSSADINVNGMTARVVLRQNFKNQTDAWQQGVYTFPLPDNAAVNALRIVIGDRVIEGEIKEKQQAKKIFNKAKASGKKASLVEQQRPNMFSNSVANIGPGETVSVEITYIQPVSYQAGLFSLRFPMTITPRYTPGTAAPEPGADAEQAPEPEAEQEPLDTNTSVTPTVYGWAINTAQVPDAALVSPPQMPPGTSAEVSGNTISITGRLNLGMNLQSVDSAYHTLALARRNSEYEFSLAAGTVPMTQDFVLNWRPKLGSEPEAAVFTETVGEHVYANIMLLPPHTKSAGNAQAISKEQVFIIDTSGSMGGVSIEQARASLSAALNRLQEHDWFNIVEFDSNTRLFAPEPVQATHYNIARAQLMVSRLQASGGTEMLPALQAAMRPAKRSPNNGRSGHNNESEQQRLKQIVFITDGAVSNEQALFAAIHKQLGSSRLFMVGIGSAPNSHFMRKASQFGRGTFTHIGTVSEVSEKMQALFAKLESPVVTHLQVQWLQGANTESYPSQLPDLYFGEPLVLSSKIEGALIDPAANDVTLSILGRTANTEWQRELTLVSSATEPERNAAEANGNNSSNGIATVWARRKIASLLDLQAITGNSARNQVLPVALTHKLLSPFTSFVAVEKKRSRPASKPLHENALANAKPKGQTPQQFAFPKGSTEARASFIWSALLLLMLGVIRWSMKAEQRYVLTV